MAGLLSQIRALNGLGALALAEPFAGGAGASLTLLYLEEAREVHINDADPSIHAFWWAALNRPKQLLRKLEETPVTTEEWVHQREIYRGQSHTIDRGFAAFYLNRCNRSGIIIDGGPIGGLAQSGPWKIDARFNKSTLRERLEKIAQYRTRIRASDQDGIDFITSKDSQSTFFFIDPPYFEKGQTLYLNTLDYSYHRTLADRLYRLQAAAWVLTYDDCSEVRALYQDWASIRPFSLRYAASERRYGNEILITPNWMQLPSSQGSAQLKW